MTEEHKHLTASVKMVMSVPLFDKDRPSKVVAVLSLDDTLPPGDYSAGVQEALSQVSTRVRDRLVEANYSFPG